MKPIYIYLMDLAERLVSCKQCDKRKFDSNVGIVCSLTLRKPDFENSCTDFIVDPKEAAKVKAKSYVALEEEKSGSSMSIWGVLAVVFIIIRIVMRFARD